MRVGLSDHRPVCSEVSCLIGTKRGLFGMRSGALESLLPGEYYGVTRRGEHWYVFQKLGTMGRILRLQLGGRRVIVARQVGPMLSEGCHQIDFIDDVLYIADTYRNRLLVWSIAEHQAEELREHAPFGPVAGDRDVPQYVHMNSVWGSPRGLHVVLHNQTRKTGRPSELVLLSKRGEVLERKVTQASHAHNVIEWRGKPLYCDSQNAVLRHGDDIVFRADLFTRGLAVTHEHILVGGSEYGDRERRTSLQGRLYVLSHDFDLVASIPVPGMVQEIRGVHADLGLSQCVDTFGAH